MQNLCMKITASGQGTHSGMLQPAKGFQKPRNPIVILTKYKIGKGVPLFICPKSIKKPFFVKKLLKKDLTFIF